MSSHFTHTMLVRDDETGDLVSTTMAKVLPSGAVVDMAGHFAYGRGSLVYDDVYQTVKAEQERQGRTVELIPDLGETHRARLRNLLLPPTYTRR